MVLRPTWLVAQSEYSYQSVDVLDSYKDSQHDNNTKTMILTRTGTILSSSYSRSVIILKTSHNNTTTITKTSKTKTLEKWSWPGQRQACPHHTHGQPHQPRHRPLAGRRCCEINVSFWALKTIIVTFLEHYSCVKYIWQPSLATGDSHDKSKWVEDPAKQPLKGEVRGSN